MCYVRGVESNKPNEGKDKMKRALVGLLLLVGLASASYLSFNRVEGDIAVLTSEEGNTILVPVSILPDSATTGILLTKDFQLAPEATDSLTLRVQALRLALQ